MHIDTNRQTNRMKKILEHSKHWTELQSLCFYFALFAENNSIWKSVFNLLLALSTDCFLGSRMTIERLLLCVVGRSIINLHTYWPLSSPSSSLTMYSFQKKPNSAEIAMNLNENRNSDQSRSSNGMERVDLWAVWVRVNETNRGKIRPLTVAH